MKRTILVLTASHLCRNPRVVKEATTLASAGYEVTVLTVSVAERFERMDLELLSGLPFRRRVIDYTKRRSAACFAQRGATWLARKLCGAFGFESAQTLGPAFALLRRARALPTDLTIVHTEIPIWAARHLIRAGRRVAADFEDWHSEDLLPADRRTRPVRLLRRAEAHALRHCVYTSATSDSMAQALAAEHRCPPPVVVRNTFPLQPRTRLDRDAVAGPPKFVWFSQTVGPGRGLEEFLAAWVLTTRPSQVYLIGDARPALCDHLLATLPVSRRDDLRFLSPVSPTALPDKLAEFDFGLALELKAPRSRDVTITNKILQYLNAGLAIVATGTAGQREVMTAAPGCGLLVDLSSPTTVAAELDSLLADTPRRRAMQLAARIAAEREFCWEKDSVRLQEAVVRALTDLPAR
jgi:glycosyltransferase involved in cell wall biosynthesis